MATWVATPVLPHKGVAYMRVTIKLLFSTSRFSLPVRLKTQLSSSETVFLKKHCTKRTDFESALVKWPSTRVFRFQKRPIRSTPPGGWCVKAHNLLSSVIFYSMLEKTGTRRR